MLETIAWISISIAFISAVWIAIDEMRHPQSMAVMNVVWPVTALYFSIFAVWAYYRVGRKQTASMMRQTMQHGMHREENSGRTKPTAWQVAVGTSHCGAGCMLADVFCDFGIAAAGITLAGSML